MTRIAKSYKQLGYWVPNKIAINKIVEEKTLDSAEYVQSWSRYSKMNTNFQFLVNNKVLENLSKSLTKWNVF